MDEQMEVLGRDGFPVGAAREGGEIVRSTPDEKSVYASELGVSNTFSSRLSGLFWSTLAVWLYRCYNFLGWRGLRIWADSAILKAFPTKNGKVPFAGDRVGSVSTGRDQSYLKGRMVPRQEDEYDGYDA